MMPRTQRWILSLAAVCAALACGDGASTEPQISDAASASTSRSGGDVVKLLKRDDALGSISATVVIGPKGGRIQLQDAGLRIDFPRGAVEVPTRITVTALRGRNVAYHFEPHGLVFRTPVTLSQSLRNTSAWKDARFAAQLQGSYFDRLLVDPTEVYSRSLERREGKLKDSAKRLEFTIEHFSGYMVSTGKSGIDIDIDVDITAR
jgi:hypothetical protein